MIAFYSRVAGWLKRFRLMLWIFFGISILLFGWVVLNPINPEQSPIFLGSVLLFGWTLCLLMIQACFSQPVERPGPDDTGFLKIKKQFFLGLTWAVALFVTGLAVKMMMLTVRCVNVMISQFGGG